MLTIVAPTEPDEFQAVLPLNPRLAQDDPILFGKVDPRHHMVVFTGGSPPEMKRLLCDHIRGQELRNRRSPHGGASRLDRFVQIPTTGPSQGVRLGGDTPSKLSLLAAGNSGDREHVVFATIVGEPHSEITVYRSDLEYCRVVHCATNGVGDAPSAIILAIGFNCKHLDRLAVVVKIHNARKSQTEVQVVTPSSIQQLLMQNEEFQSCVRDSDNRLIDATRLKSVGRKGTRRVEWPAGA